MNWYNQQVEEELRLFRENAAQILEREAHIEMPSNPQMYILNGKTILNTTLRQCSECLRSKTCTRETCDVDRLWNKFVDNFRKWFNSVNQTILTVTE